MLQAVSKNTFLTFVEADDECEAVDEIPRSRSAESTLSFKSTRRFFDPQQEQIHHALQKLNNVLCINAPDEEHAGSKDAVDIPTSQAINNMPTASSSHARNRNVGVCELLSMRDRLGHALSPEGCQSNTTTDASKDCWKGSNGSISTMATEDTEMDFKVEVEDVLTPCVNQNDVLRDHRVSAASCSTSASQDWSSRNTREDFSHGLVPRNQNLVEIYNSTAKDAPPTTMMIRNIPARYTQRDLMKDLHALGLAETYDFLYMPVDNGTSASVGYAFVNFINPSWATACQQKFQNYRFKRQKSSFHKAAVVSVAHLQGLEANLQHYENSAVNACKLSQRRPVVMANISKMLE